MLRPKPSPMIPRPIPSPFAGRFKIVNKNPRLYRGRSAASRYSLNCKLIVLFLAKMTDGDVT